LDGTDQSRIAVGRNSREEAAVHPKRLQNPQATCPKHTKKDYHALVKSAWDAGWWCVRKKTNYIHCYPPDDGRVVIVPSTPNSRGNRLNNLKAEFADRGLEL